MSSYKIVFLVSEHQEDPVEVRTELIETELRGLDYELTTHRCSSKDDAISAARYADIVLDLGVPISRDVIGALEKAQAIICQAHGFDHVDIEAASAKGILVINSAGYCADEVVVHAMALLLACARRIPQFHELVRTGRWDTTTRSDALRLPTVYGQTLGIIGLGNIGRMVARRAQGFDMNVIAFDPFMQPWIAAENKVALTESLDNLAERSDYVIVIVPSAEGTSNMITSDFFRMMKSSAYFINVSRGSTVDEEALIEALRAGRICGAALDVFQTEPTPIDNPLLQMDNVVLSPHTAGTSDASASKGQTRLGQEAARIIRGERPMSPVNSQFSS